jgi:predicted enzyme related to lactoylglutathione lyase
LALATTGLLLLAVGGCTKPVELPPLTATPTGAHLTGKFIWRDLLTSDVGAARKFYGALFGWQFADTANGRYVVITHGGRPIGGMVAAQPGMKVNVSQWVSWLSVPDVDAAAQLVRESGGNVIRGPLDLAGRGRLAVVTDPQGALLVLVRTADGDPPDGESADGDWLWTEIWTHDAEASSGFYGALVGYAVQDTAVAGAPYRVFRQGRTARAGLIRSPFTHVTTNWLPYIRVADAQAVTARVEGLGGRVLVAPADDRRRGTAAIIGDPSGAAFAIQQWPLTTGDGGAR